jgi:hypothetical protein
VVAHDAVKHRSRLVLVTVLFTASIRTGQRIEAGDRGEQQHEQDRKDSAHVDVEVYSSVSSVDSSGALGERQQYVDEPIDLVGRVVDIR